MINEVSYELEKYSPPQEIFEEQNKAEHFDKLIKYLNYLAHEIEDIGSVAARLITERRNKYNFFFEQNKQFLKDYALEHMKRNAEGEIKGKNYKSLTAGGGVFFRAKPEHIHIETDKLGALKEFIEKYLPDKEVIIEKTQYAIAD